MSRWVLNKWQSIVDTMAELVDIPAGLIMRLEGEELKVLVSSQSLGNPYHSADSEHFAGSGLYCETVINTGENLLASNALADPPWQDNPNVKFDMISYLGVPILWPDGQPFGGL